MSTGPVTPEVVAQEIVRLHEVIEAWYRGTLDRASFEAGFTAALHPAFEIVAPDGTSVGRAAIVDAVRAGAATASEFRIEIDAARIIRAAEGVVLAGYIERQWGAPSAEGRETARRATVLFEVGERLLWRHLHETWTVR